MTSHMKINLTRGKGTVELDGRDISHVVRRVEVIGDSYRPGSDEPFKIRPEVVLHLSVDRVELDLDVVNGGDLQIRDRTDDHADGDYGPSGDTPYHRPTGGGGPWTRHGHDVPGITAVGYGRPPVSRCGGPGICTLCSIDAARITNAARRV